MVAHLVQNLFPPSADVSAVRFCARVQLGYHYAQTPAMITRLHIAVL